MFVFLFIFKKNVIIGQKKRAKVMFNRKYPISLSKSKQCVMWNHILLAKSDGNQGYKTMVAFLQNWSLFFNVSDDNYRIINNKQKVFEFYVDVCRWWSQNKLYHQVRLVWSKLGKVKLSQLRLLNINQRKERIFKWTNNKQKRENIRCS